MMFNIPFQNLVPVLSYEWAQPRDVNQSANKEDNRMFCKVGLVKCREGILSIQLKEKYLAYARSVGYMILWNKKKKISVNFQHNLFVSTDLFFYMKSVVYYG